MRLILDSDTDRVILERTGGERWHAPLGLLAERAGPPAGWLPPGVRLVDPERNAVVLEQPPGYHTLVIDQLHGRFHEQVETRFRVVRVPLPWLVFVEIAGVLSVFARTTALRALDDPLALTPLPAVHADGTVCDGSRSPANELVTRALVNITTFMTGYFHYGFYPVGLGEHGERWPRAFARAFGREGSFSPFHPRGPEVVTWWENLTPGQLCRWSWPTVTHLDAVLGTTGSPREADNVVAQLSARVAGHWKYGAGD